MGLTGLNSLANNLIHKRCAKGACALRGVSAEARRATTIFCLLNFYA